MVGISEYVPGEAFTYYFGSAWSKYDMPDFNLWQATLQKYARDMKSPLKVAVQ